MHFFRPHTLEQEQPTISNTIPGNSYNVHYPVFTSSPSFSPSAPPPYEVAMAYSYSPPIERRSFLYPNLNELNATSNEALNVTPTDLTGGNELAQQSEPESAQSTNREVQSQYTQTEEINGLNEAQKIELILQQFQNFNEKMGQNKEVLSQYTRTEEINELNEAQKTELTPEESKNFTKKQTEPTTTQNIGPILTTQNKTRSTFIVEQRNLKQEKSDIKGLSDRVQKNPHRLASPLAYSVFRTALFLSGIIGILCAISSLQKTELNHENSCLPFHSGLAIISIVFLAISVAAEISNTIIDHIAKKGEEKHSVLSGVKVVAQETESATLLYR